MKISLENEEATEKFALKLAALLKPGMAVGLVGPLGAGKTTLARHLVGYLGSSDPVSSPTFVLEHEYQAERNLVISHRDLYRLSALPEEFLEPPGPDQLYIVEWPDKVAGYLDTLNLVIEISYADDYSSSSCPDDSQNKRCLNIQGSALSEIEEELKSWAL